MTRSRYVLALFALVIACVFFAAPAAQAAERWAPLDANGWSDLSPSGDSRLVYVSSSEGDDSNDGLSEQTPKATLSAGVSLLRDGYPDWLLLKRGDVWYETFGQWRKSGRSASEPMVITSYGDSGPRPMLKVGTSSGFFTHGGGSAPEYINYLAFVGLHFYAHTRDPESPEYTGTDGSAGVSWLRGTHNLMFEDMKIEYTGNAINVQQDGDLIPYDVVIRRCVLVDTYSTGGHCQGIYTSGVRGLLIEENVIDHCGWPSCIS